MVTNFFVLYPCSGCFCRPNVVNILLYLSYFILNIKFLIWNSYLACIVKLWHSTLIPQITLTGFMFLLTSAVLGYVRTSFSPISFCCVHLCIHEYIHTYQNSAPFSYNSFHMLSHLLIYSYLPSWNSWPKQNWELLFNSVCSPSIITSNEFVFVL